ncbi:hypothetical protein [Kumtagia ephedrae]|uniref:Uncharacterized protein n=1 Tax=Kumtagia ephedrae TaxID=2116701 RepID=A0A2P7S143_9HYPH|nr:hypothetical protein [Mesorhizobium ephedrae]PSJ56187.1 hypothetical protein C7I84_21755 [Mesorhizobium ephedrae]
MTPTKVLIGQMLVVFGIVLDGELSDDELRKGPACLYQDGQVLGGTMLRLCDGMILRATVPSKYTSPIDFNCVGQIGNSKATIRVLTTT